MKLKHGVDRPGILDDCLTEIADGKKNPMKTCFDGKKINSCLSEEHVDVDLFDCEKSPTLQEQKDRRDKEIEMLQEMTDRVQKYKLDSTGKEAIKEDIHTVVKTISIRIKDLRQLTSLRVEAVQKFKALGMPNWRKSKYAFVISSMQTSLFEIKEAIASALNRLCKVCPQLSGVEHLYKQVSTSNNKKLHVLTD